MTFLANGIVPGPTGPVGPTGYTGPGSVNKIVEIKSNDYVVSSADVGKTLVMDTAGKKFTLGSVSDVLPVGFNITLVKANTGLMTVQAYGSEILDMSSAGGTLYSDDTTDTAVNIYAEKRSITNWITRSTGVVAET